MGYQKGEKYPAKPLSETEVKRLMKQFNPNKPAGKRDLAIFLLMVGSGLRVAEALSVDENDFNEDDGILFVPKGKGDKARFVPVPDEVWKAIRAWRRKRASYDLPLDAPFFCTIPRGSEPGGRPLHRENYRKEFKAKAKKAGLKGRVHCHALRHTFAYEHAKDGTLKPHELQGVLGHASLDHTTTYLAHLCPTDLREKMQRRVWAYG